MELDLQQQLAVKQGIAVPVIVAQTECVVVRKDIFEQSLTASDPRSTYGAVLKAWNADDDDPAQYEEYLRDA